MLQKMRLEKDKRGRRKFCYRVNPTRFCSDSLMGMRLCALLMSRLKPIKSAWLSRIGKHLITSFADGKVLCSGILHLLFKPQTELSTTRRDGLWSAVAIPSFPIATLQEKCCCASAKVPSCTDVRVRSRFSSAQVQLLE